jgi:uncharacterized integral membrane protein
MQSQRIKYGILITIAVLATIIVTQNLDPVTMDILFWEFSLPVIVFAVLFFAAGAVAGFALARSRKRKME